MTVITGIRTGLKIAGRIDRKYRLLDPTNKFIQKYVPPNYRARAFKIKKYLDIAIGGGIIYDLLNIDFDSTLQKRPSPNSARKARDYMVKYQSKRGYGGNYNRSNQRGKLRFCKPFYRNTYGHSR